MIKTFKAFSGEKLKRYELSTTVLSSLKVSLRNRTAEGRERLNISLCYEHDILVPSHFYAILDLN